MKSTSQNWLIPRIQDIFFVAIFVAVLSLGNQMLNLDGDLPRHLLMGKYILQNRMIPTTELFVYPYLNQPYVSHEWLTDVLFYLIYSSLGLAGLVALSALLLATTFTILYRNLVNTFNIRLPILILVAWGAAATSLNWAIRPHLVSMLLLAQWLLWTDSLQRRKKVPIWLFPLSMLLWSNLHGEFIAGILVLCAYAFGWVIEYMFDRTNVDLNIGKNLWLALVLSTAASLINPSGIGPWLTLLGFVNNQYLMSRMIEANAPNFQNPEMQILLGLFAASIFLLSVNQTKLSVGKGLLLAGFSAMSLLAIRNIHLYGIVAPFVLAETLGPLRGIPVVDRLESSLQSVEGRGKGFVWVAVAVIGFSSAALVSNRTQSLYQFTEPAFPVQAVAWLESNPHQGNMFNDLNWGGYLGLHLWPHQLAFIDSMADTTGQVTRQYESVITLQGDWQEILKQYNIRLAILPPQWLLTKELISQGWEAAYQDQTAIILVKK